MINEQRFAEGHALLETEQFIWGKDLSRDYLIYPKIWSGEF